MFVGTGTALGQLIAVLSSPVLARLYSPSVFGAYTTVSSIVTAVSTVATLRMEFAVPLPAERDLARAVIRACIQVVIVTSAVTAVAVAVYLGLTGLGSAVPGEALWCLPILVLLTGLYTLLSQAALREQAYSVVAVRALAQNGGAAIAQVGLSFLTRSSVGLLGGLAVGRLLAVVSMARQVRPLLRLGDIPARTAFSRYRRFPLVLAPSAAINVFGTVLPVLAIQLWYGAVDTGNFGVAQQVVLLPAALVSTAVGQVFVGELAQRLRSDSGSATSFFMRASRVLTIPGAALFVGVMLLAEPVIPLVLGAQWNLADDYARAMAASAALGVVVAPLTYVLIALERTTDVLVLDVLRVLVVGGAGLISFRAGGSGPACVSAMLNTQAVVYVATWFVCLKAVRRSDASHRPQ